MFTTCLPRAKSALEEETGRPLPGVGMRYDPVLDDALTYLIEGEVTEFERLPAEAQVRARFADGGHELGDHRIRDSAEVVVEHLRTWAARHLHRFYTVYDVVDLAVTTQVPLTSAAQLVFALDTVRAVIAAQRRLPEGDELARILRDGWTSSVPRERMVDELCSTLHPWSVPVGVEQS
jgi:hypothetical protein